MRLVIRLAAFPLVLPVALVLTAIFVWRVRNLPPAAFYPLGVGVGR